MQLYLHEDIVNDAEVERYRNPWRTIGDALFGIDVMELDPILRSEQRMKSIGRSIKTKEQAIKLIEKAAAGTPTKVQESRLLRLRQSLYDLKIEKNRMTIVLRKWQDQLALREQAKEKK